jgi:Ran GTPase-activating protein (RanGAP) involved in mRNA processing and transport
MPWREQLSRIFGSSKPTKTTSANPDFGELRALLQRPPSEDGWLLLTGVIDHAREALPEDEFEHQWIDYARDHLKSWPPHLRKCPEHWCEALLQGQLPTSHLQLVRHLDLTEKLGSKQAKLRRVVGCAHLSDLERLELGNPELSPQALATLLYEGPWKNLRELLVTRVELSDEPQLLAHENCANLETLELNQNELQPEVLEALLQSASSSKLRALSITNNPALGPRAASHIADNPELADLRVLELCGCGILGQGLRALAASPNLARLDKLGLRQNRIEPGAIEVLEHAPWANLTELDIAGCLVGDHGAKPLLAFPFASALRTLEASGCGLGPEGLALVAHAEDFKNLRVLDVTNNDLGGGLPEAFAGCVWEALEVLDMRFNGLRDDDVRALLTARFVPTLRDLSLAFNMLGDEAAAMLGAAPLEPLERLDLNNNSVTDRGARSLMESTSLQNVNLDLGNNLLSDDVRAQLDRSPLFASVHHHSFKMAPTPTF